MTTFDYTSGDPSNLTAGGNASMADIQGPFVDLRDFVNGNLGDINLSAAAAIQESKLAAGATGLAKGAFSAYRNAAATYATGAAVVFDAEDYDVSGWHAVANGRYTPQTPGYYRLSWCVTLLNPTQLAQDGWVQSYLRKNGTAWKAGQISFQRGLVAAAATVGSANVVANGSTDFFDVRLDQNTGASAGVTVGSAFTYFQGEFIGRV